MSQFHPAAFGTRAWEKNLVRELAWVLIIKTIALFLIWLAFFSEPLDDLITDTHVHESLFSPPSASATEQHQPQSPGGHHG